MKRGEFVGAMAAVLKDALEPNLVQTAEGTPVLIHEGPFANIAHGTASLISIELGLSLADYCVVEAGFGSDLGAEKFLDIASRIGGLNVDAAMIVASVRALRYHGGVIKTELNVPNPDAVRKGLGNLRKHIENVRTLGSMPIVALNKFRDDTQEEIRLVERFCRKQRIPFAVSTVFEQGGQGALELARQVKEAANQGQRSRPIYPLEAPIEQKLEAIAKDIYGATGVDYGQDARKDIQRLTSLGLINEPVCVAKTPLSLTDEPDKIGRPREFSALVRRMHAATGAGFNIAYMSDIVVMPGLPKVPSAATIKLSDDGIVTGVF